MPGKQTQELQAEEREMIRAIQREDPSRIMRPATPDPDLILGRIGVTFLPEGRPAGYIRLYPQDFLVEEVGLDGARVSLREAAPFQPSEDARTLWVDCVKAGISGPHAVTDLAQSFGIDPAAIGYAGIKDAVAITSQRMSLRGVPRSALDSFQHERIMLRPVAEGSGVLQPGNLSGNRFTLLVRGTSSESIEAQMEVLSRRGFYNMYGPQRFGPRLIAHRLGQAILKNDVEAALRQFFGEAGPFDVPLFRDTRHALADAFGDWKAMHEIASYFPYTMRDELRVLDALVREPRKTRAALGSIRDQVKLWVHAYASWLINRRLSETIARGEEMPTEFRLPLAVEGVLPEYAEAMQRDGTTKFRESIALYPFLQTSTKGIPTMVVPRDIRHVAIPQGWIIRFSLGKGAYATSCLSHIFRMYEGLPVPEWVPDGEVDTFNALGDGDLQTVYERFRPVLTRRDQTMSEEESPE